MRGGCPRSPSIQASVINFRSAVAPSFGTPHAMSSSTMSPSVSGEICVGRFRMKNSTLLCVDDDLGILEFYETMLGSNGYHVLLAQDGRQALAVFQEKVKEIDAVISDYEMPGMNGIELAAELKRYNSSLPVIMISGCLPFLETGDDVNSRGSDLAACDFTSRELLAPSPMPISRHTLPAIRLSKTMLPEAATSR